MSDNNLNSHHHSNGLQTDNDSSVSNYNADDELNLKQLFVAMWRRRGLILSSIIIFGVLAGIIAFLTTPVYESEGSLLIYEPQSELSGLGLAGSALGSVLSNNSNIGLGTTVNNQLEVLRSRRLSSNIADSLIEERIMPNGRQYPVISKDYQGDSTLASRDTVISRLQEKLVFRKAESGADVINIIYDSPSPLASGRVVNIVLSQFNKLASRQNRTSVNSTATFLKKERARIKDSLRVAEENLRVFMNTHKLVQVDTQTQELIEQIADLEARRQEARALLVATNSAIKQYQIKLNDIEPGLAEQYSEAVGPNISRLQYAKSELELQKQQLLTRNPELEESSAQIENLNREIKSYKLQIKKLTQELIGRSDQYLGFLGGGQAEIAQNVSEINQRLIELQVQQKQYQSQIKVITSQLEEQNTFFNNLPNNIVEFARLKRDVKINEELFAAVSRQYAQTSIQERSQFGLGRIIDEGYTPEKPVKPNKLLYILFGFIFGGVLSAGYVFTNVAFFSTINGISKMKNLGVPLLAVIPALDKFRENRHGGSRTTTVNGENVSTNLITFLQPDEPISEPFRELENNLVHAREDKRPQSIAVTSSVQGEGKTTSIANLGVVLAEAGHKVVIADIDFRRPQQHEIFGLAQSQGITDVLSGGAVLDEVIQSTGAPGLSLLAAGERPAGIAATTKSSSLRALLKKLEKRFDYILVDTAPFGRVTDSALLLKQIDAVAVAAKFGETSEVKLRQTLDKLLRLNINVSGTVLTAYNYDKSHDVYPASEYDDEQQHYVANHSKEKV